MLTFVVSGAGAGWKVKKGGTEVLVPNMVAVSTDCVKTQYWEKYLGQPNNFDRQLHYFGVLAPQ
jgi:hypothetical protein